MHCVITQCSFLYPHKIKVDVKCLMSASMSILKIFLVCKANIYNFHSKWSYAKINNTIIKVKLTILKMNSFLQYYTLLNYTEPCKGTHRVPTIVRHNWGCISTQKWQWLHYNLGPEGFYLDPWPHVGNLESILLLLV